MIQKLAKQIFHYEVVLKSGTADIQAFVQKIQADH